MVTLKLSSGLNGNGLDPWQPEGSPFVLLSDVHFWLTDPKFFITAPLHFSFTNFEGQPLAKKRIFFVKIFQKGLNTLFWLVFYSKRCMRLRRTVFAKKRLEQLVCLTIKKPRQNLRQFFESSPPPLEKILDPPLVKFNDTC